MSGSLTVVAGVLVLFLFSAVALFCVLFVASIFVDGPEREKLKSLRRPKVDPPLTVCAAQMAERGRKMDVSVSTCDPSSGMSLTHCKTEKVAVMH